VKVEYYLMLGSTTGTMPATSWVGRKRRSFNEVVAQQSVSTKRPDYEKPNVDEGARPNRTSFGA
jgi:hypothetical protein